MGEYGLGIDLGSRFTAAAITAGGAVEAVRLGGRRTDIPTAVFLRPDGTVLIGEGARRRGESEPARLAVDLLARLTDQDPVRLGDTELTGPAVVAQFLDQVIATASRGRAGRLARVVLTHPVGAGPEFTDALRRAAELAGLPEVTLHSEAVAAAARARPGELVAVYDLGATFRATALRRTDDGAEILATERGPAVDFDRMVYEQIRSRYEVAEDEAAADLARLRRECAEAVESLSFDTETEIAVDLPGVHTRVAYRRAELEELVAPALTETVAALRRAFTAASVRVEAADAVVLVGGSARIPLVGALVSAAIGRSVPPGEQPEMAVAMGAARLSLPGADLAVSVAFPAIVMPPFGGSPLTSPVMFPALSSAPDPASPASASPASASPASASPASASPASASPAAEAGSPGAAAGSRKLPGAAAGSAGADAGMAGAGAGMAGAAAGSGAGAPGADGGSVTGAPMLTEAVSPTAVRPPFGAPPPTRRVRRNGHGALWTYRWPIAVGVAGLLVAAAVTVVALRPGGPASPVAGPATTAATPPVTLLWKASAGPEAVEAPAVSGNRIVLAGVDGRLRGYDRDDGTLAWSVPAGSGARVAAGIPGRRAYATTTDGHLLAVDTGTGREVWRRATGTRFDSRPVVGAGRVYAGGRDGVLYAYALGGGHDRWRVWADDRFSMTPALVGGVAVAFAGDGRLYGTDRDGTPLWKPPVGPATSGPVAVAGGACVPLADGTVRCVRADSGEMLPVIRPDGTELKSVAGADGVLFAAGADGSVGAWEPFSGRRLWLYRPPTGSSSGAPTSGAPGNAPGDGHGNGLGNGLGNGPGNGAGGGRPVGSGGAGGGGNVLDAGVGRLLARTGEVDVAYPDGRVIGLDETTGAVRWSYTVGERLSAEPAGDDGGIFLLGSSGVLYALRPPGAAAGLGSSPSVAPPPAGRPPAGDDPPVHRRPHASPSASESSEPTSEPPASQPPDSTPPDSPPPTTDVPDPGGNEPPLL